MSLMYSEYFITPAPLFCCFNDARSGGKEIRVHFFHAYLSQFVLLCF